MFRARHEGHIRYLQALQIKSIAQCDDLVTSVGAKKNEAFYVCVLRDPTRNSAIAFYTTFQGSIRFAMAALLTIPVHPPHLAESIKRRAHALANLLTRARWFPEKGMRPRSATKRVVETALLGAETAGGFFMPTASRLPQLRIKRLRWPSESL